MTITPELEAVARAICTACEDRPDDVGADGVVHWQSYLPAARSALLAIREPTERMYNAASDAGDCNSQQICTAIHYAIIDHILGGE